MTIKEHIKRDKEQLLKRYEIMISLFIMLFLLTGCSSKNRINDGGQVDDYTRNIIEQTIITQERDFDELILNNPIDNDPNLKNTEAGSVVRIDFAVQYRDAWEAEIQNTLVTLKQYLSKEDYALLMSAYSEWEQYMKNMTFVEQKLFYPGSEYEGEHTNMPTGDNGTYPCVMETAAARTKNYAIELKVLEYALTGKVEFIYSE